MKEKITFLVFHLVGYDSQKENQLTNRVDVKLIDTSYEHVLERAKKLFDRAFWFPVEVTEFENK